MTRRGLRSVVVGDLPDLGAFGAAFEEFMHAMTLAAVHGESEVAVSLREHLRSDPKELPTTGAEFSLAEQANLQLALDAVLGDAEVLGFTARHLGFASIGLSEILAGHAMTGPISFGPVQYADVQVGDGRVIQCVASGVFLAVHAEAPVALVLSRAGDHPMQPSSLKLEGVSPVRGAVSGLLGALRAAMREHNVFRGQIISLYQSGPHDQAVSVQFHAVPPVARDEVILPPGTLERLERHAIGAAERGVAYIRRATPQTRCAPARASGHRQDTVCHVSVARDARAHDDSVDRPRPGANRTGARDRAGSRAGHICV